MSVVEVFHVSLALLQTPNGSRIYSNQNLKKVLSLQRFLTASDLLTSDIIWIGLQKRKEQNKQNGRGRYSLIQGRQRIHKHHFCYIFEKCKRDSYRPIRERIKSYKTNPCRDWKITRLSYSM